MSALINTQSFKGFGKLIRYEFPIFDQKLVNGRPLSFLDSAASSQKPAVVIDRLKKYYSQEHSNVHRGAYSLSANATDNFEKVRNVVAKFIDARSSRNIVFTKGTTDSINLAALSLWNYFKPGDNILLSLLEHHSNIVPWQLLAKKKQLNLHFADIDLFGNIDIDDFAAKVKTLKPALISITAQSNALGSLTPLDSILQMAKSCNALTLVDAAQWAAHEDISVSALECDFLCFSSHKLYGPTGAGILYVSNRALDVMEPAYGGGEMISSVSILGSTWAEAPHKFEAGTPAIAEIIGMGVALEYLYELKLLGLAKHENYVFNEFFEALAKQNGLKIFGPRSEAGAQHDIQASIISFQVEAVHPHDFATIADQFNVQLRAGNHCAQPLLTKLGLNSTARISIAAYSDIDQIEPLMEALREARRIFT